MSDLRFVTLADAVLRERGLCGADLEATRAVLLASKRAATAREQCKIGASDRVVTELLRAAANAANL
jgi:hypothetical protein